jgi:pimeloyl-ACP methyl ester carboxylesterase
MALVVAGCAASPVREPARANEAPRPAAFRSGYAPVNGLRMYYEIHGSGPPLLLLHGGGSSIRTTFGEVLPMFAARHRVIAVEQQGHGHTADIDRPLSFEQMADDTDALLAHLGVERADVFGFSNGGSVAMQLAIRHPNRVERLVVGSAFYTNEGLQTELREMFRKPANAADMPAPLRDEYLRVAPNPGNLQRLAEKIMAMLSGFRDWPAESMRAIAAPTLILSGNADVARPEHVIEMCRLIRRCELAILPGGHGTYIGEATAVRPGSKLPSLTVALVEEFLRH